MDPKNLASKAFPRGAHPPESETDEVLQAAFVQGDESAFQTLFHRHCDRLVSLAYHIMGDFRLGEELVRRALVRVFRSRRKLGDNVTLRIKLLGELVRQCRKYERIKAVYGLFNLRPRVRVQRILPLHRLTPPLQAGHHNHRQTCIKALARVPLKLRECVALCDLERLTYEEASMVLGVRPRIVGIRLGRGRFRFAAAFLRLSRK